MTNKNAFNVWIASNVFGIGAARTGINSEYWTLKTADGVDVGGVEESSVENAWLFGCQDYTRPAAAMEVLKKCIEASDGYQIQIDHGNQITWGKNGMSAQAETIELAICQFAKKLFS